VIYRAYITFTTNFLGGGSRDKKTSIRSLKRTFDGLVEIHSSEFHKKLKLANKQVEANIDVSKLKIPNGFEARGQISVLKRIYNKVNIDLFEGIARGNTVSIDIMCDDDNCPKEDTMAQLVDIIGRFHGISQWGSKFNCGRFKIKKIERVTIDNYES